MKVTHISWIMHLLERHNVSCVKARFSLFFIQKNCYIKDVNNTMLQWCSQCTNGHLMCAGCFTHVLADARLRDELATCPNCRIEISKTSASRNLAVEKAVSELPAECQYCAKEFPRNYIEHHEEAMCEERWVRNVERR